MPYADVNGLHLYYEEQGVGPPLVLLHGGLMTIELNFGIARPALAEHHRVITVELQGHGRTADIDRPPPSPTLRPTSWPSSTSWGSSEPTSLVSVSAVSPDTSS